jgi:hypothetical protein
MNNNLLELHNIKEAIGPVDANTAAITGARVKLSSADRLAIAVHMGDSTSAVVTLTLRQHNAASAGTSKDLSVSNPYYHKVAAATSFTKVEPAAAAAAYDLAALLANDPGIVVFEVLSEQLDVNNGYYWASIDMADSTAAKLVSAVYILGNSRQMPAYDVSI